MRVGLEKKESGRDFIDENETATIRRGTSDVGKLLVPVYQMSRNFPAFERTFSRRDDGMETERQCLENVKSCSMTSNSIDAM